MTVTGARLIPEGLDDRVAEYLQPFAGPTSHFFVGGAVGIDTVALNWLAQHSESGLTVVVPCTLADQPAGAIAAVQQCRDRGRLAELVELRAPALGNDAYHARNRWMVDRSELVIGFPNGTDPASGTWYTLRYAAELRKPRLIVPL